MAFSSSRFRVPKRSDILSMLAVKWTRVPDVSSALYINMSHTESEVLDQYYTVAEIAKMLNVHEITVRQWYVKNNLKIQRVGRKGVRIAARDLKAFLAQLNEGMAT